MGSSYTPGLFKCPLRQNRRVPPFFGVPRSAYHSAPPSRIVRHAGQSLGIIDYRRTAPQSDHGRKGRPNAWNPALALERLHQRRLFADFVGARAAVPINVEVASAAENVFAEKSLGIGIGNRLLHDLQQIAVLAANVDVASLSTRRRARRSSRLQSPSADRARKSGGLCRFRARSRPHCTECISAWTTAWERTTISGRY